MLHSFCGSFGVVGVWSLLKRIVINNGLNLWKYGLIAGLCLLFQDELQQKKTAYKLSLAVVNHSRLDDSKIIKRMKAAFCCCLKIAKKCYVCDRKGGKSLQLTKCHSCRQNFCAVSEFFIMTFWETEQLLAAEILAIPPPITHMAHSPMERIT